MLFSFSDGLLDSFFVVVGDFVFELGWHLFGLIDGIFELIACVDSFLFLLIFASMHLGILLSLFDILLAHVARVLNGNALLFAGTFIFGGNIQDTVSIKIESNLNLRNAAWSWSDTIEHEAAKRFVVFSKFTLTLKDMNFYLRLIVASGREDLRLAGRNSRVTIDEWSADAAHGFNTESKRSDIKKKHVFDITGENATLNSGTDSHNLIWVDALHWVFAEEFLDTLDHGWHTSHTTNHDDFVNVASR